MGRPSASPRLLLQRGPMIRDRRGPRLHRHEAGSQRIVSITGDGRHQSRVTVVERSDGSRYTVTVPPLGMISESRWKCWEQVNAEPWISDADNPGWDWLLDALL